MAEADVLVAEPREGRGSRTAQKLRQKGLVPAVLYGHKEETVSVAVSLEELERLVRRGLHVVDLKADGGMQKALIKELQWDHLGKHLLHVDFARIAEDE